MEYSLVHVRATPENVDDALGLIATDWSGEVIKPQTHLAEVWSTVLMTDRAASNLAPLLSEFLDSRVAVATVHDERFSLAHWQPGSHQIYADGRDNAAAQELASAFGQDPADLQAVLQSSEPATERHTRAAELLILPMPALSAHHPIFDGQQALISPELEQVAAKFRGRRRIRRIRGGLGVLQVVAFLAVDYFWFINPSILLVPALAVFVVNGVVLLSLRRLLPRRPKSASGAAEQ